MITGNKTDSTTADMFIDDNDTNETEDDDAGEHDAGEQGNITVIPGNMMNISTQATGNMMNISTQATKVMKNMGNGLE